MIIVFAKSGLMESLIFLHSLFDFQSRSLYVLCSLNFVVYNYNVSNSLFLENDGHNKLSEVQLKMSKYHICLILIPG